MIKLAFSDMKTGCTVMIEVAEAKDLKEHWVALGAIGIQPVGCHSCKGDQESSDLPTLDDFLGRNENNSAPGGGQLPENWNPDDNLPTG